MTIHQVDKTLMIQGALCYDTVPSYLRNWQQLPSNIEVIDFAKLDRIDSAGLGLVVNWLLKANKNKQNIRCLAMPKQLINLSEVTGISRLIGSTTGN